MQEVTYNTIRELSLSELDEVNGEFLPVIGFGLALFSHIGVGGVASSALGHVMSGVGLGMATFAFASYMHASEHRRMTR
jgi:hypothetical protein